MKSRAKQEPRLQCGMVAFSDSPLGTINSHKNYLKICGCSCYTKHHSMWHLLTHVILIQMRNMRLREEMMYSGMQKSQDVLNTEAGVCFVG